MHDNALKLWRIIYDRIFGEVASPEDFQKDV